MISVNIIQRIFHLRFKEGEKTKYATSFTIEYNNKHYLISARHTFSFIESNDEIEISLKMKGAWTTLKSIVYFHKNSNIDIAVFPLNNPISETFEIILSSEDLSFGQDVFFLGYPFGMYMKSTDRDYPFVKKGIISAIINENNARYVYVDGHNNKGFSGGPIFFIHPISKKTSVFGVISGYVPEKKESKSPIGPFEYSENSGIIEGFLIEHVIEIIKNYS